MKAPVISLFSGVGGLDLGFEAAGFQVAVAVEKDDDCVEQLRRLEAWPVIHGDIHHVDSQTVLGDAGLKEGDAAVLIGGPPCQPFSKAGFWAKGDAARLDDPRAGTLEAYLRILRDTLPRAFLLENVEGLVYRGKSEGLDLLRSTIDAINEDRKTDYSFAFAKLNAADFGVPQQRERIFVVGARDGSEFSFPAATHGPEDRCHLLGLEPRLTAWDAIGDLEEDDDPSLALSGKWADLLPSIPEGENYLWHTDRKGGEPLFGWRRRYWNFLLKLAKAQPSWTIQAQPGPATGPFHWRNRRLSGRELARLQTFPETYRLVGSISVLQKQLGNAVPSAMGEMLARAIGRQLLGYPLSAGVTLIPERRVPVPKEEPVQAVPAKYLALAGDHAAHPGTGQGYRARATASEAAEFLT